MYSLSGRGCCVCYPSDVPARPGARRRTRSPEQSGRAEQEYGMAAFAGPGPGPDGTGTGTGRDRGGAGRGGLGLGVLDRLVYLNRLVGFVGDGSGLVGDGGGVVDVIGVVGLVGIGVYGSG
jgi:hypothetical protein